MSSAFFSNFLWDFCFPALVSLAQINHMNFHELVNSWIMNSYELIWVHKLRWTVSYEETVLDASFVDKEETSFISLLTRTKRHQMCEFSATLQSSPENNCVSYNLIQFWLYLPGEGRSHKFKGSVPQDCSHFRCQFQGSGPQVTCNFCSTWLKTWGSHDSLLSFNNLLEWLTRLGETLCLPVYCKGHNLGTATWKRCVGQGMKKEQRTFNCSHVEAKKKLILFLPLSKY